MKMGISQPLKMTVLLVAMVSLLERVIREKQIPKHATVMQATIMITVLVSIVPREDSKTQTTTYDLVKDQLLQIA